MPERVKSGCTAATPGLATLHLECDLWPHDPGSMHWDSAADLWWLTSTEHTAMVATRRAAEAQLEAEGDGPLLDPDCRDGKCGSCIGAPCEHECHGSPP